VPAIRTERIYADVSAQDGQRVLIDRIWPRGIRKEDPRVGHAAVLAKLLGRR
jgi:uncharacterized protein YeaO (DUF488 family)